MPQLDFLIYGYQFTILFVIFFLLYDLILNYWLPAFLGGLFLMNRIRLSQENILICVLSNQSNFFFNFSKKIKLLFR